MTFVVKFGVVAQISTYAQSENQVIKLKVV